MRIWSGMVALSIGAVSLSIAAAVGISSSDIALAVLSGLLASLGLVSLYALLAWPFGWPKLRWDDVTALWYLLP